MLQLFSMSSLQKCTIEYAQIVLFELIYCYVTMGVY